MALFDNAFSGVVLGMVIWFFVQKDVLAPQEVGRVPNGGWCPSVTAPSDLRVLPETLAGAETVIEEPSSGALICSCPTGLVRYDRASNTTEALECNPISPFGRPLGIRLLPGGGPGSVLTAVPEAGLIRLQCPLRAGELELGVPGVRDVLLVRQSADGAAIRFADDLAVTRNGTVYFSDATVPDGPPWQQGAAIDCPSEGFASTLRGKPDGRLLRVVVDETEDGEAPSSAMPQAEVLLEGLHFANGVALAPDESFVLVAETTRQRITRLWLEGPLAGTVDTFADNLPGWPDNINLSRSGETFLVALVQRSTPFSQFLLRSRIARFALRQLSFSMLHRVVQTAVSRSAGFVALDAATGEMRHCWAEESVESLSSVVQTNRGDELLLGSVAGRPAILAVPEGWRL